MWEYIIQIIWLFFPAGCANIAASMSRYTSFLNIPIDFNKKYKGQIIFGPHKTYRGFLFGIVAAILIVVWQKSIYPNMINYSLLDYEKINIYCLGFLMGLGALMGDLIKSLFKRRSGIESGASWFPWDQIDWALGTLLFVFFYINISWDRVVVAIILATIFHLIFNYLGYIFRLKKNIL